MYAQYSIIQLRTRELNKINQCVMLCQTSLNRPGIHLPCSRVHTLADNSTVNPVSAFDYLLLRTRRNIFLTLLLLVTKTEVVDLRHPIVSPPLLLVMLTSSPLATSSECDPAKEEERISHAKASSVEAQKIVRLPY